ncbi:hypothetical protein HW932_18710 [Allochromatium humboldtianum]|uniref:Uncharacterized protein n=1 Tax=Allochromatium humboldtianum TaxID=504901 RepID=A0A850RGG4_9GAMM|nr:hypothetical protein [Allochromatium humboldtianum]NVZ11286.1 hypothetical protein [Allochromatium humboldtianum]
MCKQEKYLERILRSANARLNTGKSIDVLTSYFDSALSLSQIKQLLGRSSALRLPVRLALDKAHTQKQRRQVTRDLKNIPLIIQTLAEANRCNRPLIDHFRQHLRSTEDQFARLNAEQEQQRLAELRDQVEEKRNAGTLIRWLAGLSPSDRRRLGTRAERQEAAQMRKEALKAGAAREMLQCSLAELNRWTEEGRLTVLFYRREPTQLGKTIEKRFWSREDLESAIPHLNDWRSEWEARKKAKRTKLRDEFGYVPEHSRHLPQGKRCYVF